LELLIMEPQTDLTVAKNASVKRASAWIHKGSNTLKLKNDPSYVSQQSKYTLPCNLQNYPFWTSRVWKPRRAHQSSKVLWYIVASPLTVHSNILVWLVSQRINDIQSLKTITKLFISRLLGYGKRGFSTNIMAKPSPLLLPNSSW
jgi:hypothetical protein